MEVEEKVEALTAKSKTFFEKEIPQILGQESIRFFKKNIKEIRESIRKVLNENEKIVDLNQLGAILADAVLKKIISFLGPIFPESVNGVGRKIIMSQLRTSNAPIRQNIIYTNEKIEQLFNRTVHFYVQSLQELEVSSSSSERTPPEFERPS